MPTVKKAVAWLEANRETFDPVSAKKRAWLFELTAKRRCPSASDTLSLHESVCFARGYPDNAHVLAIAQQLAANFHRRPDVKRFRADLAGLGISGIAHHYRFYWPTARWLAVSFPGHLRIDWDEVEDDWPLRKLMPSLFPRADGIALEEEDLTAAEFLSGFCAAEQTDAELLIQRFLATPMCESVRERIFDDLDLAFALDPGAQIPARITAGSEPVRPHYQTALRSRERPDAQTEWRRTPKRIRWLSRRKAVFWIDQARSAMLTRSRDLEAIAYANPNDVVEVLDDSGLSFVGFGILPERRFLLEGTYVFLVVQNGVPIGYMQGSGLFGWAEINFNIFEPFRGRDSARLYGRSLAVLHAVMGTETFVLSPYQIGDGNEEAIATGAFWFYYKLGFRPRDAGVRRLVAGELRKMKRRPRHRTSAATLRRMAEHPMFLALGEDRQHLRYGSVGRAGLLASRHISRHSTGDRDAAIAALQRRACKRMSITARRLRHWSSDERQALNDWAPLIDILPDADRWSASDRAALRDIVQARGGPTEAEYLRRLNAHARLESALIRLVG